MSASIVVISTLDIPARDRDAACADCGRRGTIAYGAWLTKPPAVSRYCRRCWPAAQNRWERDRDAQYAAQIESFLRRRRAGEEPENGEVGPGWTMSYHWSVLPGTLLRTLRYERERRRARLRSN
jgi:hypothetical protein